MNPREAGRALAGLAAAAALFAVSLAAGRVLERKLGMLLPEGVSPPRSLHEFAARGFSVRRVAADFIYMELLQYIGGKENYLDRCDRLVQLTNWAIDIDPCFNYIYMFSSGMLMWDCNRPKDALPILEKGIERNPADQRMKLYLAAFTYYRLNDLSGQVKALETLALTPGVPSMVVRILANVYAKQGRIDRAIRIWRYMVRWADNEEDRRWAAARLMRYGAPAQ